MNKKRINRIVYPLPERKSLSDRKANGKGIYAEMLFFKTFRKYSETKLWVKSIRFSSVHENYSGIDFFVYLKDHNICGSVIEIPIQIKSSKRGVRKHIRQNTGKLYIQAIVVKHDDSKKRIYKKIKDIRFFYNKKGLKNKRYKQ